MAVALIELITNFNYTSIHLERDMISYLMYISPREYPEIPTHLIDANRFHIGNRTGELYPLLLIVIEQRNNRRNLDTADVVINNVVEYGTGLRIELRPTSIPLSPRLRILIIS